ncbi:ATP-binding protein [Candidatus Saccharibacteria bacterium]|nr:ATP-binding protein [Candidatus Saccharibacteria bacterium]
MYRDKIKDLIKWKNSSRRKPLVLSGARQVGKTWLLKEFGNKEYESVAYVNFYGNSPAKDIFELDLNPERIINALEVLCNTKIEKEKTLIILDEIQDCKNALASLKNFCEEAPEYHIAVAGSLLGISLHDEASFPVGKVNSMFLYPLSFCEFIRAIGKDKLADALETESFENLASFHATLMDDLKNYLIIGGMPAVVQNYLEEDNILQVRAVQQQIISDYIRDFSKHAHRTQAAKIWEIFNVISSELAKENKKFLFSMIKKGARAAEYEEALLWLEDAGIASRVRRVKALRHPLSAYLELDAFKLFLADVGLLGALAGLDIQIILRDNDLFTEFKGALAEQFVFQELKAKEARPFYYHKDKPEREIDFLLDGAKLTIIEVKSGKNLASKSLTEIVKESSDEKAYKLSILPYQENETITNLPIYLAGRLV